MGKLNGVRNKRDVEDCCKLHERFFTEMKVNNISGTNYSIASQVPGT